MAYYLDVIKEDENKYIGILYFNDDKGSGYTEMHRTRPIKTKERAISVINEYAASRSLNPRRWKLQKGKVKKIRAESLKTDIERARQSRSERHASREAALKSIEDAASLKDGILKGYDSDARDLLRTHGMGHLIKDEGGMSPRELFDVKQMRAKKIVKKAEKYLVEWR